MYYFLTLWIETIDRTGNPCPIRTARRTYPAAFIFVLTTLISLQS